MEERRDSIALDMDIAPWSGQEYLVPTTFGHISVTVCGDQDKPALVTYPDVGLNYLSCFEGLFSCPVASSVLFHNFCIYHIDPPGHETGAPESAPAQSSLSVDDLADQVAEVLAYFGLDEVIALGVTGGAYILSLFACKYTDRALGLILVSPLARSPSWTEWLHNQALVNLLYFCGMAGFVKELFFQRYFSSEVRDAAASGGRDVLTTVRRYMDDRRSKNVMHYLQAIHQRRDLTENLKKLKCRTLILVGDQSPFHHDALHINNAMNRRYNALIQVEGAGSLVTEERPQSMLVPIELFLTGYAFYQRPVVSSLTSSPKSPLSPPCMPAELLSPESLGLKLKPIKTRVTSSLALH